MTTLTHSTPLPPKFRADEFISLALACGRYSFDVEHDPETGPHDPDFKKKVWGFSFATYMPDGSVTADFLTDLDECKEIIGQLFVVDTYGNDQEFEQIAYNGKYDLKCAMALEWAEEYPTHFRDPMVAVNLLEDNRRPNQIGLKPVVKDYYGHEMMAFKDASAGGRFSEAFRKYSTEDAFYELCLYDKLKPQLIADDLWKPFTRILMEVSKVFADMEISGIRWECREARTLLVEYGRIRDTLEMEILSELGEINLNSGDQLAHRLFDELGYSTRGIPLTPSGKRHAVDAKAMEILASRYPVCEKISFYRTCNKLIGTYVEPLTRRALDSPESRIHPTFWLVSSTGRTRSEKPNLQNIPARLDSRIEHLSIRNCFTAPEGRSLIVADLSQIELRLAAHITEDAKFLSAYRDWQCKKCKNYGTEKEMILHECPVCGAAENEAILKPDLDVEGFWHGLDLHTMTSESVKALRGDRQAGKTANFALIYLATAMRMHQAFPDFSIEEWDEVIHEYMELYSGIKAWHIRSEYALREHGVSTSVFGRKRRIPKREIAASYKHALNQFVNFPVQASACEYIELCLVKMRKDWKAQQIWLDGVWPVNFVHDEIVLEVENELVPQVASETKTHLETSVQFRVPIRADVKIVEQWGKAK